MGRRNDRTNEGTTPVTTVSWKLTGFGDEIDPDPSVQVAALQALGAHHIEVRSAWGINVVDLDDEHVERLAEILSERSMGVSAIASPIGKVDITLPLEHEQVRLERAIEIAHHLKTRYIRLFSFYRGEGIPAENIRSDVITRMCSLADLADQAGVILLHENEKEIYGDTPERCLDVVESVDSPALRLAWDSANFVQVGTTRPFDDGYTLLRPFLEYFQVKDALAKTGEVTPAGLGDGQVLETLTALRDDGYVGFVSLEPHLTDVNALGGFSGPEAFGRAARALRTLTDSIGVTLV